MQRQCFRSQPMRALEYIREPRRLSLGWRAGLANAIVFAIVFILFIVTPVTVHAPPRLTEVFVLAGGLGAMLAVNLLLLRRALSPLRELGSQMDRIDLRDPTRRLSGSEAYGPALTAFVETFNAMVDRLAEERRAGARAALTAQERERLRIGRARGPRRASSAARADGRTRGPASREPRRDPPDLPRPSPRGP